MARLYSPQEVADVLGLHVRTVRGYVRDGRLKAVRIGKQYKIAESDLEEFTGRPVTPPARETAPRRRQVEVSSIVQIDAIGHDETTRLTNTLTAMLSGGGEQNDGLRVQTVYDPESARLKIIVFGGPAGTAELLKVIEAMTEEVPRP